MTTYIDTASIAPTIEDAIKRCENLGISGYLIPDYDCESTLNGVTDGDTVICGPLRLPYWRQLPSNIRLVSIAEPNDTDPLPNRVEHDIDNDEHLFHVRLDLICETLRYVKAKTEQEPIEWPYLWKLFTNDLYNEAKYMFEEYNGSIGVDVETDIVLDHPNEMQDKLVGVGIAFGSDCYYGSVDNAEWIALITEWLPRTNWVGHNAKYDRSILHRHGIRTGRLVGDSMLAAYLLGIRSAKLKPLVRERYGQQMVTYEEVAGKGKSKVSISEVDQNITAEYCCGDAYWALRMESDIRSELGPNQLALYEMDLKLAEIVGDMEEEGTPFDRESATKRLGELEAQNEALAFVLNMIALETGFENPRKIYVCEKCHNGRKKRLTCDWCAGAGKFSTLVPINPGSTDQVGRWLHEVLQFPIQGITGSHKPQVNSLALLRLANIWTEQPHGYIPKLLLEWKQRGKYIGYLKSWIKWSESDFRLHPVFPMSRTRTGRFSSEDPNVQQVKLDWRKDFIAPEGRELLAADYAQIEVRIPAYMSRDPLLMQVTMADSNTFEGNLHAQNTFRLFGIPYEEQSLSHNIPFKTRAKNYWFGAAYGSKGYEIQTVLEEHILKSGNLDIKVPSLREIMNGVSTLHDIYGQYFLEWVPSALYQCREKEGYVYTLWGRPQCLTEIFSKDGQEREHAERQCISHIIQGTAGDFLRSATCGVRTYIDSWNRQQIKPKMALHLTVHDELVISASNAESHASGIKEVMELGQPIMPVPLIVDITTGKTWLKCHK